jgi:predicted Fe-Mo cluster-binding NifX family protein
MKIAVTYENGEVFQHFGHTSTFKIYEVKDNKVLSSEIVPTNGSSHGALSAFLEKHGVNKLICGGIGSGAKTALAEKYIEIFGGVSGDADKSVNDYLAGKLKYDPDKVCNHHHEDDHDCGENHQGCSGNCGSNKASFSVLKPGSLLRKN